MKNGKRELPANTPANGAARGNKPQRDDNGSATLLPEWERVFALVATMLVLFFYTRACPFPSGTFWDLFSARDFDINLGWTVMPEFLAFSVVQSSASLLGLKAIYHIAFFVLLGFLVVWVFRSREILPGLLLLAVFAFGMQPLLSLRHVLQLLFLAGFFTAFSGTFLKNAFGIVIIPAMAAAGVIGLNTWMLLAFVTCHALFRRGFQWTLVLCGLMGLLIFPESTTNAYTGLFPLANRFMFPEDQHLMMLLGGIFLVPNLLALPMIDEESFPGMIFYALTTIAYLLDPGYGPAFVLAGFFLLTGSLNEMEPLSPNVRIVGAIILALVIHVFLLYSPMGFKLNPVVRQELGPELEPVLSGKEAVMKIRTCQIAELAWKGMLNPRIEDLALIQRLPFVIVKSKGGNFELEVPEWLPAGQTKTASDSAPLPVDLPGKAPDAGFEPQPAVVHPPVPESAGSLTDTVNALTGASTSANPEFQMPSPEELAFSAAQRSLGVDGLEMPSVNATSAVEPASFPAETDPQASATVLPASATLNY